MGSSIKWVRAAVSIACIVLATSGCKNLLKKKLGGDAGASTTAALTGQDLADEQLGDKLDEFIKCLNSLSSPIHQSRHRYFSLVPKNGPTGREVNADLYRLPTGSTASCSAGVSRSKVMPPSEPKLESAGSEFALAAAAVDQVMNEADTYYELKGFHSDKWARGKALHPRLVTAWERFSKADKNLHDALDGITKPLAQRVLARIDREEGKKFRYGRKKVLITSRELVEAANPIGEDDDIDFQLYSSAYTDFEKGLDELTAYGNLHKADLSSQQKAPSWPAAEGNYDAFIKEANDFKKAAKEFWRCLRDAPAKAKTPSGKIDMDLMGNCADGPAWKQSSETLKQYNEFVRTSNARQFP
jgi:hypothetical protein